MLTLLSIITVSTESEIPVFQAILWDKIAYFLKKN
jgi:hypothetical protein